jgi:hypothetical protein
MIYFLILVLVFLSALLALSIRKNLYLQEKIENISESLEESLDVLDLVYQRIVTKTQLEVLSDDPIVRELAQDLKISRDSVHAIANLISDAANKKVSEGD